jgi:formate/nitrite transporter FocA (FNT family)
VPFGLLRLAEGGLQSGVILVVVGGAELFTGNNYGLGRPDVSGGAEWLGNLLGAVGTAVLVLLLAGVQTLADGAVGETMVQHRPQQDRPGSGGGLRARHPLQRAGLPRGLALHGRADRGG